MCKIETFNSNFDVDHRFLISFFIDLHHFKLTQYSFDFLFNLHWRTLQSFLGLFRVNICGVLVFVLTQDYYCKPL